MVQHMDVPALTKQWVLDAQWTDCPLDVEQVVKDLWRYHELGNDKYMLRASIDSLRELVTAGEEVNKFDEVKREWGYTPLVVQPLIDYLIEKGIPEDEVIIIHWWW